MLIVAALPLQAADPAAPATLAVTGRASLSVQPDTAIISFSVESNARNAGEAIEANANQADRLLKALKPRLGPKDRLKTSRFHLQPLYWKEERLRSSGYRVSNRVVLETRQTDKVGTFIDEAARAGISRIGQLRFQTSEATAFSRQAAAMAVGQARITAEKLAEAAGVSIRRVLEIRYADTARPVPLRAEVALARNPTPIEVGDLTIEASVSVVYEIGALEK